MCFLQGSAEDDDDPGRLATGCHWRLQTFPLASLIQRGQPPSSGCDMVVQNYKYRSSCLRIVPFMLVGWRSRSPNQTPTKQTHKTRCMAEAKANALQCPAANAHGSGQLESFQGAGNLIGSVHSNYGRTSTRTWHVLLLVPKRKRSRAPRRQLRHWRAVMHNWRWLRSEDIGIRLGGSSFLSQSTRAPAGF